MSKRFDTLIVFLEKIYERSQQMTKSIPCLRQFLLSIDNICKQFGPRSGHNVSPDLILTCNILRVFLKELLEKVDFEKSQQMIKSMQNYQECRVRGLITTKALCFVV